MSPMLVVFVGGVLLVCIFCSMFSQNSVAANGSGDDLSEYSNSDIQAAALRVLKERPECSPSWIGGTVERCDDALNQIVLLRKKYDGYRPTRMRKAVMDWLDYYERAARKNRDDCESQKSRKDLDACRVQLDAENARTREILNKLEAK